MFKCEDFVVYGASGVCKVEGLTKRDFGNQLMEYYVLKPTLSDQTTIYAPKNTVNTQIRSLITKQEAEEIVAHFESYDVKWIIDDIERKSEFRKVLKNNNPIVLAQTLKTLYTHRFELSKLGKKLHSYDEEIAKSVEKLLVSELSFVLEAESSDILNLLKNHA